MALPYRIFTGTTCGSSSNFVLWSFNVDDPDPIVGGVYNYGGIYYTALNSGTTLNTYPSYLGPVDTNINYGTCPIIARPFSYNPTQLNISGTYNIGTLCVGVDVQNYSSGIGGLNWWNGPNESEGWCIGTVVTTQNQSTPLGNIGNVKFWRGATNIFTDTEFLNVCKKATGQTFTDTPTACAYLASNNYWTSFNNVDIYYFVVSNRSSYSKRYIWPYGPSDNQYIMADTIPSYKLFQKINAQRSTFGTYTYLYNGAPGSPAKLTWKSVQYTYNGGKWLTDVNVYKSGVTVAYGFPNGGTSTYGTTVYQNIVAPWVP
jgi:hypothetical protein